MPEPTNSNSPRTRFSDTKPVVLPSTKTVCGLTICTRGYSVVDHRHPQDDGWHELRTGLRGTRALFEGIRNVKE